MDKKYHLLVAGIVFSILWLVIPKIQVTDIIFPVFLTIFPDIDLAFEKRLGHRSMWTHSIILPLLIFLFNSISAYALILLSIGIHLACDVDIFRKKGGFYTIVILNMYLSNKVKVPKYRLKSVQSTVWLIVNFFISLSIFIWWLTWP